MGLIDFAIGFAVLFFIAAVAFVLIIGGYGIAFQILVPYPADQVSFCNEMGLDYHWSWTDPITTLVTCSRTINDCPNNNCKLIIEKIAFRNYPEKIGEVV